MAAGELREISSSEEFENVLELVRDPLSGMRARRNDDVGHDQSRSIPIEGRAPAKAGLAEPDIRAHAHDQRACFGDTTILVTKRGRSLQHAVDVRSELWCKLNRWVRR